MKYLETCKTQEREQRRRRHQQQQQQQDDSQNKQLLQDGSASISTSSVPGATISRANGAAATSMELDGIAYVESPRPNDGK